MSDCDIRRLTTVAGIMNTSQSLEKTEIRRAPCAHLVPSVGSVAEWGEVVGGALNLHELELPVGLWGSVPSTRNSTFTELAPGFGKMRMVNQASILALRLPAHCGRSPCDDFARVWQAKYALSYTCVRIPRILEARQTHCDAATHYRILFSLKRVRCKPFNRTCCASKVAVQSETCDSPRKGPHWKCTLKLL